MSNYVVLDLEMCRVHSEYYDETSLRNEVIQIGAVLLNQTYNIIGSFMTYVSPQLGSIDPFIEHLTGITNDKIKGAPIFKEALEKLFNWIPKDTIFVAWSESDEIQLLNEMECKNVYVPEFDSIEWMDCQELFNNKVKTSKNYKLSEALRISDINIEYGEHDALIDAINTAKLFKKIQCEKNYKFNDYYVSECDVHRSTYNPFAQLLKNYRFES